MLEISTKIYSTVDKPVRTGVFPGQGQHTGPSLRQ